MYSVLNLITLLSWGLLMCIPEADGPNIEGTFQSTTQSSKARHAGFLLLHHAWGCRDLGITVLLVSMRLLGEPPPYVACINNRSGNAWLLDKLNRFVSNCVSYALVWQFCSIVRKPQK